MKCPYLKKVIHKSEVYDMESVRTTHYVEFCDCIKSECPFYWVRRTVERCRKAESEVVNNE